MTVSELENRLYPRGNKLNPGGGRLFGEGQSADRGTCFIETGHEVNENALVKNSVAILSE